MTRLARCDRCGKTVPLRTIFGDWECLDDPDTPFVADGSFAPRAMIDVCPECLTDRERADQLFYAVAEDVAWDVEAGNDEGAG